MGKHHNAFRIIICICFVVCINSRRAYCQNLVKNGDVEISDYSNMQTRTFIERKSDSLIGWNNPGGRFSSPTLMKYPVRYFKRRKFNREYHITPQSGNNFIGLWLLFSPKGLNYRDYIEGTLIEPLESGTKYRLGLKVCLRAESRSRLSTINIVFSDRLVEDPLFNINFNNKSDVTFDIDSAKEIGCWYRFFFDYVAKGGEKHFILGNFLSDSLTKEIPVENIGTRSTDHFKNVAAYFFDDFSIEKIVNDEDKITPSTYFFKHTIKTTKFSDQTVLDSILSKINQRTGIHKIEIFSNSSIIGSSNYQACLRVKEYLDLQLFPLWISVIMVNGKTKNTGLKFNYCNEPIVVRLR